MNKIKIIMLMASIIMSQSPDRYNIKDHQLVPKGNPLILFVGDLNFYAKGASRINAMEQLGATVIGLSHTPLGGDETGKSSISIYFRILLTDVKNKFNVFYESF